MTTANSPRIPPDAAILAEMWEELLTGDPLYMPSQLWMDLGRHHTLQLRKYGMERFKRTVNQSYFNAVTMGNYDEAPMRPLLDHWLQNPRPLKADIGEIDFLSAPYLTDDMIRRETFRNGYRLLVDLLWNYLTDHDPDGLAGRLSEPELGDPIPIRLDGKLISQDLAASILERNTIASHMPTANGGGGKPVIAEIGAGYGRLGHVFLASAPCRYMIFDIPPTLFVSQWYLSTQHPDKRVFPFRRFEDFDQVRGEVEKSDICFFTANQLELLPAGYIDCFIAIDNLHEMRAEQVARFVDLIADRTGQTVYIKNAKQWTNEVDRVTVGTDDYRLDGDWRTVAEREDPVWTNYINLIYRKT